MSAPAVILGGGLAGAAAATLLTKAGRDVTVIERQSAPTDKICGEFLSREAQLYLQHLGLDLSSLGGHRITGLRLIRGGDCVRVGLPFAGLGLSRRVLDEALLNHAVASGATALRGKAASLQDGRVFVSGVPMPAGPILLATGKHDLRALPRVSADGTDNLVGFKTYFRLTPAQTAALAGHVEVLLFKDGYAGLQLVEGGRANLCLLVQRARLQRVGFSWAGLLDDLCVQNPHLRIRLDGAMSELAKPLAIYRVPYGFVHRADDTLYHLGDQMGVIDSFSGDGMSIALHSAALAASALVSGAGADGYHRHMRADIAGQIGRARRLYYFGQDHGRTLMRLAAIWPGALRWAARWTRVPERALARALA